MVHARLGSCFSELFPSELCSGLVDQPPRRNLEQILSLESMAIWVMRALPCSGKTVGFLVD